ncbi:8-oxo-dGTP pyrophosphatase MutT (NUDIX family) [Rhizobium sp. BK049]|uniref:NUDIX domain-containing protein n=1 Tax=Rhizobium sp. BK049 TaxID=2587095 RepID=UPI00182B5C25|nr:NUDIX domain-containing protein [Rhizobium sp. BK049]MBB3351227.1 8-oxo-dGTP pyrophosphatase MutT (NUDIX family) [Rhizobium sp. BK049]
MIERETTVRTTSPRRTVYQAAGVCLTARADETPLVLVRSKRTGDWGIPKGTTEDGEASAQTAEREAFEEAGIIGSAVTKPVGHFEYEKESNGTQYHVTVNILSGSGLAVDIPKAEFWSGFAFRCWAARPVVLHCNNYVWSFHGRRNLNASALVVREGILESVRDHNQTD